MNVKVNLLLITRCLPWTLTKRVFFSSLLTRLEKKRGCQTTNNKIYTHTHIRQILNERNSTFIKYIFHLRQNTSVGDVGEWHRNLEEYTMFYSDINDTHTSHYFFLIRPFRNHGVVNTVGPFTRTTFYPEWKFQPKFQIIIIKC